MKQLIPPSEVQAIIDTFDAKRKEIGITQQEMADKIGIRQSNYSRIVNGHHVPGIHILAAWAKALNHKIKLVPNGK